MTNKEIADWIRDWSKDHPDCKDLTEMYEDFSSYSGLYADIGALTKLIYKLNPLKHMTYIPEGMFYKCDYNEVIIPNHIKSIGAYAFKDCMSLTDITIPESVTSIGDNVFRMCRSLTSITIPNTVMSIGEFVFYGCDSLTNIDYTGTKSQWKAMHRDRLWNTVSSIKYIECSDGTVEL